MKIPVHVSCIAHQLFLSGTVVKLHPSDKNASTSLSVNLYVVLAHVHIDILNLD